MKEAPNVLCTLIALSIYKGVKYAQRPWSSGEITKAVLRDRDVWVAAIN